MIEAMQKIKCVVPLVVGAQHQTRNASLRGEKKGIQYKMKSANGSSTPRKPYTTARDVRHSQNTAAF